MDLRIVVLQRGWVVVGEYSEAGEKVHVKNGSVVRRWGTTKGLGELAAKGPLNDTVLDPIPDVEAHQLGVVFTAKCAPAWEGKCR